MLGRKKSVAIYWVVAAGVVLLWLISTLRPEPVPTDFEVVSAPPVKILDLSSARQAVTLKTQGNVRSIREVELISQVSGRVERVTDSFVAGGFFTADEPLLFIEDGDYLIAIRRAEAGLADARQLLAVEKGRARQAAREWRDLGDTDANELFLRRPQLASAEADLVAAQANLDQARLELSRTRLSLPFAGRVVRKHVDMGWFVASGTPLATVYSSEAAEVRLPLTARQWHDLKSLPGASATVTARYGDVLYHWDAQLVRSEAMVDRETRQYFVVVRVADAFQSSEEEGGASRPALSLGQFVEANIQLDWPVSGFRVPRTALHAPQQLWLVDSDERLRFLDVELLHSDGDWLIVRPRDTQLETIRLIISPLRLPIVGMPLTVLQEEL